MTEISEAAKLKAQEVVGGWTADGLLERVGAYIQQVSDAAKELADQGTINLSEQVVRDELAPFILPDPVDPLLIEARNLTVEGFGRAISLGRGPVEDIALAALKRGMELANNQRRPDSYQG